MWYISVMGNKTTIVAQFKTEVQLGDKGRVILPAPVRKRLGLRPGSRLVLSLEDSGELRLVSVRRQVEKCAGLFRELVPAGALPSQELIEERRMEAAREKRG